MKYVFKANFKKNSTNNRNNFLNKKGIMALDALIGTILSVIALFFLLQVMYMFFFQDNDVNLKIAKSDAQSIVDFVNTYSSDENNPYYSYTNCFHLLKFQNLENFQVQKDTSNTYSYIIDEDGVYIIDNNDVKMFEENLNIKSIAKVGCSNFNKNLCFNEKLNFKKDNTNTGIIKVDITFFGSFGGFNNLDINTNLEKPYIYLKQGENLIGSGFDNQNIIYPFVYENGFFNNLKNAGKDFIIGGYPKNFKLINSKYLIFSRNYNGEKNILFVTDKEISNIYIQNSLCSKKYLDEKFNKLYYNKEENLLDIDYISKKINFKCDTNDNNNNNLIWDCGFKCEGNGIICNDFLKTMVNTNNYKTIFENNDVKKNKFKSYCTEKASGNVQNLLEVTENINKCNLNFDFENLFQKDTNQFSKNLIQLTEDEKKENMFLNSNSFKNRLFGNTNNLCDKDKYSNLCSEIYIKNDKIYFYVKESISKENLEFYSFNIIYLKKEILNDGKIQIIFNNDNSRKYTLDELELNTGTIWERLKSTLLGGKIIYKLELKELNINNFDKNKEITVYLTPKQVTQIKLQN